MRVFLEGPFSKGHTKLGSGELKMRKVARIRRPLFPHKRNVDGTIESFCSECFSTVASAGAEGELQVAENAHVCKGLKLSKVLRPMDGN